MMATYMAAIRAKVAELRELLAQADIPEDKTQEINAKLDLMLEIIVQYE